MLCIKQTKLHLKIFMVFFKKIYQLALYMQKSSFWYAKRILSKQVHTKTSKRGRITKVFIILERVKGRKSI